MMRKQTLIKKLVEEIENNNLAIFAGAGLSVGAGFVDWKNLLRDLADEIGLDVDKEYDLISLAQYHTNEKGGNRSEINKLILNEFSHNKTITENHEILARLPIDTYWTTNYDSLIERSLKESGKVVDIKHNVNQLPISIRNRDAILYKMHGDCTDSTNAVLIKDDYEKYHLNRGEFFTALRGDLLTKRFLFLGLSFSDPNIDYILSRIRSSYNENQPQHYCILKNTNKLKNEQQADFDYRKRKQELFIGDLKRVGIQTVLVDDYQEITEILLEVEKSQKQKTIFISGAAEDYAPYSQQEVENFVSSLTQEILKLGYRVVTGFGLGIGSSVISGAVKYLLENRLKIDEDHLVLRPFPQNEEGRQLWTAYRKDMISYAGISIFLFGNKIDSEGKIVDSNGMQEEFDISKTNGNTLLPVGGTGSISRNLWESVSDDEGNHQTIDINSLAPSVTDLETIKNNILTILQGIK
ncbi:SIR2 family protein [Psychrobacter pacificensis]|uniref:SIR2 family protein n=1 Tax=Psychrobacter pacificensis TaxID=112002 RepID=UPI0023A19206|nr:SIR2 family protein [Psychrobacter pacificensis]MDE0842583.1 SIR2 family protein [Psychrobacter pacificensis]